MKPSVFKSFFINNVSSRAVMIKVFLACALILLKWQIVQVFAWTMMILRYSLSHGIREAMQMTFSGEYPCSLCLLKKEGVELEVELLSFILSHPLFLVLPMTVVLFLPINRVKIA